MKTLPKKIKTLGSITSKDEWRSYSNVLVYPNEKIVATNGYILAELDNSNSPYDSSNFHPNIDALEKLDEVIGFYGKELSKIKFPTKSSLKILRGGCINTNKELVVIDSTTTSVLNSKDIKEPFKYEQLFPTEEEFNNAPSINLDVTLLKNLLNIFEDKEELNSYVKITLLEDKVLLLGQSEHNKNIRGLQMKLRLDKDLHQSYNN